MLHRLVPHTTTCYVKDLNYHIVTYWNNHVFFLVEIGFSGRWNLLWFFPEQCGYTRFFTVVNYTDKLKHLEGI